MRENVSGFAKHSAGFHVEVTACLKLQGPQWCPLNMQMGQLRPRLGSDPAQGLPGRDPLSSCSCMNCPVCLPLCTQKDLEKKACWRILLSCLKVSHNIVFSEGHCLASQGGPCLPVHLDGPPSSRVPLRPWPKEMNGLLCAHCPPAL